MKANGGKCHHHYNFVTSKGVPMFCFVLSKIQSYSVYCMTKKNIKFKPSKCFFIKKQEIIILLK